MGEKFRIVGAGFSGLTLAYYLKKESPDSEIVIQDASAAVGGMLQTKQLTHGKVELAANAILDGDEIRALAADVGLELVSPNAGIKRAFFYRAGRLSGWPMSIFESVCLAPKFFRFLFRRGAMRPLEKESVESWGLRNLGSALTYFVLDAALAGIYAAKIQALSAKLIFARFFNQRSGKRRRHLLSVAPAGGMGELGQKLRAYLESGGVTFRLGERATLSQRVADEKLIFCGSLADAQQFFFDEPSVRDGFKNFFAIPTVPVSTTTLFFESGAVSAPAAFGVLFPRVEARPFLGVLFNSKLFASGGSAHSETWISNELPVNDLLFRERLLCERAFVFRQNPAPLALLTTAWPKGLPLYGDELREFLASDWPRMRAQLADRGIYAHGNYFGKLGLSQLILESKKMAHEVLGRGQA